MGILDDRRLCWILIQSPVEAVVYIAHDVVRLLGKVCFLATTPLLFVVGVAMLPDYYRQERKYRLERQEQKEQWEVARAEMERLNAQKAAQQEQIDAQLKEQCDKAERQCALKV